MKNELGYDPNQEEIEHANRWLGDFGLSLEDLKGKTVVDLGSGKARIETGARAAGINSVISLDKSALGYVDKKSLEGRVVAQAVALPFQNDSVDLMLSRASVPSLSWAEDRGLQILEEMKRVTKPKGQMRIAPAYLRFLEPEVDDPETRPLLQKLHQAALEIGPIPAMETTLPIEQQVFLMDKMGTPEFKAKLQKISTQYLISHGFNVETQPSKVRDDFNYWIIKK